LFSVRNQLAHTAFCHPRDPGRRGVRSKRVADEPTALTLPDVLSEVVADTGNAQEETLADPIVARRHLGYGAKYCGVPQPRAEHGPHRVGERPPTAAGLSAPQGVGRLGHLRERALAQREEEIALIVEIPVERRSYDPGWSQKVFHSDVGIHGAGVKQSLYRVK
jgi:hypothetical protein